jgi:thiol-disulfide isomerase/thioredoxin
VTASTADARTSTLPARLRALLLALLATAALLGLGATASATTASAQTRVVDPTADVIIFWGDGCPNCAKQEIWLEQLEQQHPNLNIVRYEVWNSEANRELFVSVGEDLGFEAGSVPTAIIGERVWIGWTNSIEQDMAGAVSLVERGELPKPGVYGTEGAGTCSTEDLECSAEPEPIIIDVPLFGEVSLGNKSLLVSTIIIGFVDGINPCSLWVLSILLTIVLRTNSRPRVLAIGSTFLVVTAVMYGLYMAAFYSALTVVGYLGIIQWVVAGVAGVFGVVSVKDYFAFKKGLSFTIKDSAKPGIYSRMRAAAGHERLIPALGATLVLAVGVSLLETPCTAGFPVLWTGMLHANGVGTVETIFLFFAYMIPFLLDELIIFGIAVFTMKSFKMQEKHGEMLKLFAGVTMLVLAAVMVINPTLMENPIAALILFAAAFVLALVIHLVTTRIRRRLAERNTADAGVAHTE